MLDTGILVSHQDFGGRAHHAYDFVDNDTVAEDGNGHGTHVAAADWPAAESQIVVSGRTGNAPAAPKAGGGCVCGTRGVSTPGSWTGGA